jgi:hypothetical protein
VISADSGSPRAFAALAYDKLRIAWTHPDSGRIGLNHGYHLEVMPVIDYHESRSSQPVAAVKR